MSVAQLTINELACFASIIVKDLNLTTFDKAARLASFISQGNVEAIQHQYGDRQPVCEVAEIRDRMIDFMTSEEARIKTSFGPLSYNMVANDGKTFPNHPNTASVVALSNGLESQAKKWQEGKQRELKRAEENAASFDDIAQLPVATRSRIAEACEQAGCQRVIIATHSVDESDGYTDYHGGRVTRRIVIGFGKGKRENFKQLRKAAASFAPTENMGPKCDLFEVGLEWDFDFDKTPDHDCWIRVDSHWAPCDRPHVGHPVRFNHFKDKYEGDHGRWGYAFNTLEAAENFKAENEPLAGTRWRISQDSYENRENYSMGGGNYLGESRYGGWKVISTPIDYFGVGDDTLETTINLSEPECEKTEEALEPSNPERQRDYKFEITFDATWLK